MALEDEGSNCFSITQLVGQKGNKINKVSKSNLKTHLFGNKTKESDTLFANQRLLIIVL